MTARQRAGQLAGLLGLRPVRADPHRHRRLRDRPQRLPLRRLRPCRILRRRGNDAAAVLDCGHAIRAAAFANVDEVLSGRYRSTTGMGIGLIGARRLVDRFQLESTPRGTTVHLKRFLPRRAPLVDSRRADEIARAVAGRQPVGLVEEFQRQNQELLRALDELNRRQEELVQPQSRARGHQPRRRRALRRARREGRSPAPRRRAEVALPLEHDPRVPDARELDPRAHELLLGGAQPIRRRR